MLIKKPIFVEYLRQRILKEKSFTALIVGATGIGKSFFCLRLAEEITKYFVKTGIYKDKNKKFNIKNCTFTAKGFMERLDHKDFIKGDVIIMEEIGVTQSSRSWQSFSNKLLNYIMQTQRVRQAIILMNCPHTSFLDAQTRSLLHAVFQIIGVDRGKREVVAKPKLVQVNSLTSKVYYKYPKFIDKEGDVVKIERLRLGLPSKELRDQYNLMKTKYTDNLRKKVITQLDRLEKDDKKPLTDLQEKILEVWNKGIKKHEEIANKLNINRVQITRNIGYIRRKGHL